MTQIIHWIDPIKCDPPHKITHPEKLQMLIEEMKQGWGKWEDVLIGYELDGRIQLISGSHRYEASRINGTKMPVMLYDYNDVQEWYGTDTWIKRLKNIPIYI